MLLFRFFLSLISVSGQCLYCVQSICLYPKTNVIEFSLTYEYKLPKISLQVYKYQYVIKNNYTLFNQLATSDYSDTVTIQILCLLFDKMRFYF